MKVAVIGRNQHRINLLKRAYGIDDKQIIYINKKHDLLRYNFAQIFIYCDYEVEPDLINFARDRLNNTFIGQPELQVMYLGEEDI